MANQTEAPQLIVIGGLTGSYRGSLSVSDNYIIKNDGKMMLNVKNAGGSNCNVTIVTQNQVGGNAISDRVVAVSNGAEAFIGPFPPSIYNDGNGDIDVSFSFITSVTFLAGNIG